MPGSVVTDELVHQSSCEPVEVMLTKDPTLHMAAFTSPNLTRLSQDVLADLLSELNGGGRMMRMQLLALSLHESIKAELAITPVDESEKLSRLRSASDQSCRAVDGELPQFVVSGVTATLLILGVSPRPR
jgi:hypothetical protein